MCIIEDPINKNLLFLGTDDGLYVSFNSGEKWEKFKSNFPTVSVKDLVIHPREQDLVIGTFGRALWILDDIRPFRAIAKKTSIINKPLELFIPPTAYIAKYQQPTGSRFGADAIYNGENRKYGAMISYLINKPKITKKRNNKFNNHNHKQTKYDSIKLEIYDGNKLIRTLKQKTPKENGIYIIFWDLTEKGIEITSRKIKKIKKEPSGIKVKLGRYKLKMSFTDNIS